MKVVALLGADTSADGIVLQLAQSLGSVIALWVGADAEPLAQAQLAARRLQVWDAALSSLPDANSAREAVLAMVVAAAARQLDAQLFVIAETADGYLGPAIAEQLNVAHVSQVLGAQLATDSETPQLQVQRRCLHGVQRLRGPCAAVLCVLPVSSASAVAAPAPSAASVPAIEHWSFTELGLSDSDLPRPLLSIVPTPVNLQFGPLRFDSVESLARRLKQDGLS